MITPDLTLSETGWTRPAGHGRTDHLTISVERADGVERLDDGTWSVRAWCRIDGLGDHGEYYGVCHEPMAYVDVYDHEPSDDDLRASLAAAAEAVDTEEEWTR